LMSTIPTTTSIRLLLPAAAADEYDTAHNRFRR